MLLLLKPLAIADVGFWLTFGATSAHSDRRVSRVRRARHGTWLRAAVVHAP